MWWIKKKKKRICKCACHWSALSGTLNPQDVHCDTCKEEIKAEKRLKRFSTTNERKILIKKLDDTVSLIVRIQADWTCVKCKRKYPPVISKYTKLPAQNLMTTSHYFGRGKNGVRWDHANLDAICIFCHQKIENNKKDVIEGFHYEQYMKQKLGADKFNLLEYKATYTTKYSVIDLRIMLAEEKRKLQLLLKQYE